MTGLTESGGVRWGLRILVPALLVFVMGLGAATYMHWPALTNYGIYKEDIQQSPHWAAYHTTSFQPDDPILRYARFNESPLQNTIYRVGTLFVEFVTLSKVLAVLSYGFLSLLFFLIGRLMYGTRFGLLLALFITLLPDQWDYSTGFFSKFWAIPCLLVCVFLLQTERFKGLVGLLPFAAIAYPTAAVLVGMTASVQWIQLYFKDRGRARELLRWLAIGSAIAVAFLMIKYASPPEGIGAMRPSDELRAMPEVRSGGYPSNDIPVPSLDRDLVENLDVPFTLLCTVLYLMVLGRRGVPWERSWTALFFASAIGYLIADYFFLKFYIPNRYTRYSLAVLMALWNARNWDLILARVNQRFARYALAGVLLVAGGYAYSISYDYGRGWTDRSAMLPASEFIREELPEGILVAGSPRLLDDVMIQARRSVLCPYKLAHPWFTEYYDAIRKSTRATLRAHFAAGPEELNELHRAYGVTHFLVEKRLFLLARNRRNFFADPHDIELYRWLRGRQRFYLETAPRDLFLWEDDGHALLELPIPVRTSSATASGP